MAVMKSVMTQDCSKEDLHNLHETTKVVVSMLGDMCSPQFIGGKKKLLWFQDGMRTKLLFKINNANDLLLIFFICII